MMSHDTPHAKIESRGRTLVVLALLGPCLAIAVARGNEAGASSPGAPDAVRDGEIARALQAQADPVRGRDAYRSCAVCHGEDGAGRDDGTFPQLAGQHASVIIKQLADIRSGHRDNPIMLPYAQQLIDAQEIADVSAYLTALAPRPSFGKGANSDLGLGARLYERDCRNCHGPQGRGDAERFIPSLAGQHYGYLLRQLRDVGAGRRANIHPEMAALVAKLSDREMQALVDYATRLAEPLERADARSAP